MDIDIMTDILEMLFDSRYDTDLPEGDAQRLHQVDSVHISTVTGTESRHGHTDDPLPVEMELIKGTHHHQESQGRVQSATDTHHRLVAVRMNQSFGQSCHLDIQDLLA